MVLMIKTEPVQHTVKLEIKRERREEKEVKKSQRGGQESKQGCKGKGMLRG